MTEFDGLSTTLKIESVTANLRYIEIALEHAGPPRNIGISYAANRRRQYVNALEVLTKTLPSRRSQTRRHTIPVKAKDCEVRE